jgi:predicted dienelactone hydrolase
MTRPVSRRWARTALVAALLPALTVAAPAAGDDVFDVPASGRLVLNGHGFGHGHGMSQYGAEGAAREGKSWRRIVGFYYPKTRWAAPPSASECSSAPTPARMSWCAPDPGSR